MTDELRNAVKAGQAALVRLRQYQAILTSGLATDGLVDALVEGAHNGSFGGIMEQASHRHAIETTLEAIPQAIQAIQHALAETLNELDARKAGGSEARFKEAKARYQDQLKRFDHGYRVMAQASDRDLFHHEARALLEIARRAGMVADLRQKFEDFMAAGRPRADELVQY